MAATTSRATNTERTVNRFSPQNKPQRHRDTEEREDVTSASENLVQELDQESRLQVVLDQALAEIPDAHLADGGRGHDVAGPDIGRADDVGGDGCDSAIRASGRVSEFSRVFTAVGIAK